MGKVHLRQWKPLKSLCIRLESRILLITRAVNVYLGNVTNGQRVQWAGRLGDQCVDRPAARHLLILGKYSKAVAMQTMRELALFYGSQYYMARALGRCQPGWTFTL